jgi:hypothetical protein
MNQLVTTLVFGAVLALSAQAQTFSTPMRDVDNEVRNAIQANCYVEWVGGQAGARECTGYTVPAGKRLAIRMINVNCVVPTGDKINFAEVYTQLGLGQSAQVPLAKTPNVSGVDIVGGLSAMFLHADPGSQVKFRASYSAAALISATCQFGLYGYLVSLN